MLDKDLSRRDFLKTLGGTAVAATALSVGCTNPNSASTEGFALGEVPTDKMSYRENAHGQKVSLLGYGCMRLPVVEGKDGNDEGSAIDQERVNELTDYAIAHGVNLFDTAPRYCKGRSEHAMGIALSRHPRDEYFISTKMSNMGADCWSRAASIAMFENSLKELQVDYLDYLLLHCMGLPGKDAQGNPVSPMDMFKVRFLDNGMLNYLMEQRAKGRIRNLGFSYHGDVKVFDHLLSMHDQVHWDHVLIQHNYIDWNHAAQDSGDANSEYLYSELAKRDIPVFVMEPLLGGQLATLPQFAVDLLKQRQPQRSIASWAFRFAGQQPRILTVLSGMTYMEHLQDNLRTFSPHEPLTEDELALLQDIAARYVEFPLVPCTGCQYCMPCPYGLDIPGIFAHYNKCVNSGDLLGNPMDDAEGDAVSDADVRAYRRARRAYLVGYDRAVDPRRQADHCIQCGRCLSECPQGIDIPNQMARIESFTNSLKSL